MCANIAQCIYLTWKCALRVIDLGNIPTAENEILGPLIEKTPEIVQTWWRNYEPKIKQWRESNVFEARTEYIALLGFPWYTANTSNIQRSPPDLQLFRRM